MSVAPAGEPVVNSPGRHVAWSRWTQSAVRTQVGGAATAAVRATLGARSFIALSMSLFGIGLAALDATQRVQVAA